MKNLMILAVIGGQLMAAAQPAFAADLVESRAQEFGAFAGFRLRLPLDGNARQRQIRAGLTLAPTMHSRTIGGETRMRIGEGLELGVIGREPVRLAIAGQDVRRLGAAQRSDGEEGERGGGPSTVAWVAIGVAGAVVATAVVGFFVLEDQVDED